MEVTEEVAGATTEAEVQEAPAAPPKVVPPSERPRPASSGRLNGSYL